MSNTVYDYVSERRLKYFLEKLKEKLPKGTDFIKDDATEGTDVTWSIDKIKEELKTAGVKYVKIDDFSQDGALGVIYLKAIRRISVTTDIAGALITVNKSAFVDNYKPDTGVYTFTFDGTDWSDGTNTVDLTTIGIDYTDTATPASGNIITVTLSESTDFPNVFEEYIWVEDETDPTKSHYELIGSTEANLDEYVREEQMHELTEAEIDDIFAEVFATTPASV